FHRGREGSQPARRRLPAHREKSRRRRQGARVQRDLRGLSGGEARRPRRREHRAPAGRGRRCGGRQDDRDPAQAAHALRAGEPSGARRRSPDGRFRGDHRRPGLDAEFAKQLGVADGDLAKMRAEIRANVEREVKKRVDARIKGQALQALLDAAPLELPKSLVEMETQQLVERAAADLQARGVKPEQAPLNAASFEGAAKRRVALGLIIAELARAENLQPKPGEVRAIVEQEAQSYESPAEVVKWFYMQPQRLSEMEGVALEANVVKWVLSKAKGVDKQV